MRRVPNRLGVDLVLDVVCDGGYYSLVVTCAAFCIRRSMAVTAFTCATWEEYYTGKLVLQVLLNAPAQCRLF